MSRERIVDLNDSKEHVADTFDRMVPDGEVKAPADTSIDDKLPPKFKGKSVDEILNSYIELEKQYGRQGGELGELRKLTDQLIQNSLKQSNSNSAEREQPLTEESFNERPLETVRKLVEESIRPLKTQAEELRKTTTLERLEKLHPDMRVLVGSQEFQDWVLDSPVREQLWAQAATGDFDYANEVFSLYKSTHRVEKKEEAKEQTPAVVDANALAAATSISSGTSRDSATGIGKPLYRRSDLIRLQLEDPLKYQSLQSEIMLAYSEGRVK